VALTGALHRSKAGIWPQSGDTYVNDGDIFARQMACRPKG
jgi:hypothetical protein